LFVPAFQRDYVWKKKDAKNLVDLLINDYPTGTMLTWETTNPPELKGEYVYEVSFPGSVTQRTSSPILVRVKENIVKPQSLQPVHSVPRKNGTTFTNLRSRT
jgi:hypothetical protein